MPKMHLRQLRFTYSACGPFIKNKEKSEKKNKNKNETVDSRYIYQNKLDKACFQQDRHMEILEIYLEEQWLLIKYYVMKHLILLKIKNIMNINVDLLQWFIKFLIKRPQWSLKRKLCRTNN